MFTFIAEHLVEIFFGLVSAGALAFCKYLHSQLKNYKKLLEESKDTELEKLQILVLNRFRKKSKNFENISWKLKILRKVICS